MLTCPNCGRDNAAHFNFCLDCGTELPRDGEPQAAAPPAAQPSPQPAAPAVAPAPPAATAPEPARLAPTATSPAHTLPPPAGHTQPPTAAPAAAAAGQSPCPVCKSPVPAAMKFCGECGARVDPTAPPPNAASQAAASARQTQFLHATDVARVMEPKAKLISIDPTGREGMTFSLKAAETPCGRVNGVVLLDDPHVSPSHCVFRLKTGLLSVEDAGSLNGVYVRLRAEVQLTDGDVVRMGRQLMRFEDATHLGGQNPLVPPDDTQLWGTPMVTPFGRLVQLLDSGLVGEVRLLRGTETRVGRELGDITFPSDGFVSGQHCVFSHRNSRVYLSDQGSSNGTYLRIRGERPLQQDDFLLLGNQMLRVDLR